MIAFLDSSAIVKLYLVDEADATDVHAAIAASQSLAASRLSYVEVRAALAAARRAARLTPLEHDRAVSSFDAAWPGYDVVELSDGVSVRAGVFAETFGLRAGDAIQLASVLELNIEGTLMVAWDARLRLAARAAGVATHPIEV